MPMLLRLPLPLVDSSSSSLPRADRNLQLAAATPLLRALSQSCLRSPCCALAGW